MENLIHDTQIREVTKADIDQVFSCCEKYGFECLEQYCENITVDEWYSRMKENGEREIMSALRTVHFRDRYITKENTVLETTTSLYVSLLQSLLEMYRLNSVYSGARSKSTRGRSPNRQSRPTKPTHVDTKPSTAEEAKVTTNQTPNKRGRSRNRQSRPTNQEQTHVDTNKPSTAEETKGTYNGESMLLTVCKQYYGRIFTLSIALCFLANGLQFIKYLYNARADRKIYRLIYPSQSIYLLDNCTTTCDILSIKHKNEYHCLSPLTKAKLQYYWQEMIGDESIKTNDFNETKLIDLINIAGRQLNPNIELDFSKCDLKVECQDEKPIGKIPKC